MIELCDGIRSQKELYKIEKARELRTRETTSSWAWTHQTPSAEDQAAAEYRARHPLTSAQIERIHRKYGEDLE